MMKYKLTVIVSNYTKVGEKWQSVEVETAYKFGDWDDVQCFLAYMVEGSEKDVKVRIEMIRED